MTTTTTYTIDDVQFNLSNPIDKYWYSKHKNMIMKNNIDMIKTVLDDVKNKKKVQYTPKYYACAKFIQQTTSFTFKKVNNKLYYVVTTNDDFIDAFCAGFSKKDLVCSNASKNNLCFCNNKWISGTKIGKCKNNCCFFRCKPTK